MSEVRDLSKNGRTCTSDIVCVLSGRGRAEDDRQTRFPRSACLSAECPPLGNNGTARLARPPKLRRGQIVGKTRISQESTIHPCPRLGPRRG